MPPKMMAFILFIVAFLSLTHWIRWGAYKIYLAPETTSLGSDHIGKYARFENRIYLAAFLDILMIAGVLAAFAIQKMAEADTQTGGAHPGWVLAFWAGVPLLLFGFFEIYRVRFEKRHNIPHLMHEPRYKR